MHESEPKDVGLPGAKEIKESVKEWYGKIARNGGVGCSDGCGCGSAEPKEGASKNIGYSEEEASSVPKGSDLGLGCGNPVAIASLKEGETVLDLGSGAGFDCFLAAAKVGKTGKVIGVDMTLEMIEKARANAKKGAYDNVEFRQGDIEALPVEPSSVDAVISNCVINLSPDKSKVFSEVRRVLRAGGRMMIADIVVNSPLPEKVRRSMKAYSSCLGGAMLKEEYLRLIEDSGFKDVKVVGENGYSAEVLDDPVVREMAEGIGMPRNEALGIVGRFLSLRVSATKP